MEWHGTKNVPAHVAPSLGPAKAAKADPSLTGMPCRSRLRRSASALAATGSMHTRRSLSRTQDRACGGVGPVHNVCVCVCVCRVVWQRQRAAGGRQRVAYLSDPLHSCAAKTENSPTLAPRFRRVWRRVCREPPPRWCKDAGGPMSKITVGRPRACERQNCTSACPAPLRAACACVGAAPGPTSHRGASTHDPRKDFLGHASTLGCFARAGG